MLCRVAGELRRWADALHRRGTCTPAQLNQLHHALNCNSHTREWCNGLYEDLMEGSIWTRGWTLGIVTWRSYALLRSPSNSWLIGQWLISTGIYFIFHIQWTCQLIAHFCTWMSFRNRSHGGWPARLLLEIRRTTSRHANSGGAIWGHANKRALLLCKKQHIIYFHVPPRLSSYLVACCHVHKFMKLFFSFRVSQ
jgi:hypothetical protein